jgi:hypothetical protein
VSYRREETAYPAGWLYERLAERFGTGQVFKDVDSIQLGDDFVEVITGAVASCDVLLALIGDQWLTATDDLGRRRIDNPDDFVRLEIEAALSRRVRVIPILVDGARMPVADELPASIATLARRHALELSPSRFEFDTSRLFRVLEWTLAEVRTADGGTSGQHQHEPQAATAEPGRDAAPLASVPATAASGSVGPAGQGGAATAPAAQGPPARRSPIGRAWALAGVGVVLVLVVLALIANLVSGPDVPGGDGSGGGIDVDARPATSREGLELTGLTATSGRDPAPPQLGDTVSVSYSLTNTSEEPISLAFTFVGVRDPADENRDTEDGNEAVTLAPGETAVAEGRVPLDAAGTWELWPCYQLADGTQCPNKWRVFFVVAR